MSSKLQPVVHSVLPATSTPTTINLPGDGNTLIAQANTVQQNVNLILMPRAQSLNNGIVAGVQQTFNCDYYNLFVVGEESFNSDHFLVPKDRALTESTIQEVKDALASLSPEAVATIKTFPALFASENHFYGRTDDTQNAYYGFVTDVKIQDNGIKIYFRTLNSVPQQQINEIAAELGLGRASLFNELNRTHWAIKRINLVEVLHDAGISVFTLT
ncbi:MAG: hypothetical protein AAGU74_04930 [Bacillota bacterium]